MDRKQYISGLIFGTSAFLLWGLLPVYWKLVADVSPYLIFAHRALWSFVFMTILLCTTKRIPELKQALLNPRTMKITFVSAIIISMNWMIYIWAVNNGYIIESSLGYFINPLVLTIFGVAFYKEKLSRYEWIGIGFAALGVIIKSIYYGRVPIIALLLAITFALYGLLKKKSELDALLGLGVETLIISVPSLLYIFLTEYHGVGIGNNFPIYYWPLIMMSGVVTALPLILYGKCTKILPLTIVGFLQYNAPSLMLILGIFVYNEDFTILDFTPFGMIWIGLMFFSYSQFKLLFKRKVVDSKSNHSV
jgi:chloramphenicol-sensitive protein RarD